MQEKEEILSKLGSESEKMVEFTEQIQSLKEKAEAAENEKVISTSQEVALAFCMHHLITNGQFTPVLTGAN